MPKKAGTATVSLAGKLDDRTARYTVPMKAVPQQCGVPGQQDARLPVQRRYSVTCTPFQNATRPLISAAASLGSG